MNSVYGQNLAQSVLWSDEKLKEPPKTDEPLEQDNLPHYENLIVLNGSEQVLESIFQNSDNGLWGNSRSPVTLFLGVVGTMSAVVITGFWFCRKNSKHGPQNLPAIEGPSQFNERDSFFREPFAAR